MKYSVLFVDVVAVRYTVLYTTVHLWFCWQHSLAVYVNFIQRTCRQLWRENPFHPSLNGFKYLILLYLAQCALEGNDFFLCENETWKIVNR